MQVDQFRNSWEAWQLNRHLLHFEVGGRNVRQHTHADKRMHALLDCVYEGTGCGPMESSRRLVVEAGRKLLADVSDERSPLRRLLTAEASSSVGNTQSAILEVVDKLRAFFNLNEAFDTGRATFQAALAQKQQAHSSDSSKKSINGLRSLSSDEDETPFKAIQDMAAEVDMDMLRPVFPSSCQASFQAKED